ncbi:hypothetical protein C5E02_12040 [Rathayibacter rathayi]|nr:hypothetical protein C1O28_12365 [Rathayibacter rathayi]PPG64363.1 hypothetical protein C5C16_14600 [Rathayibacter rathayi]PPG74489.1 hypothetical protein C5C15_14605 [Rathayibacter rathayi]PPI59289.1 hypothetical protein C5E02_12040 [Rathayibacter rathayi]SOE05620.1 ATP dependent DNA ligase domain-containing protein [Rathayibacter rathayi NCPPB 2980 = VKM Ac-1601]
MVAVLTGRPDGGLGGEPRRYALLHTGSTAGAEKNWLLHLMAPGTVHSRGTQRRGRPGAPAASPAPRPAPSADRPGEAAPPRRHRPMLATAGRRNDVDPEAAIEMKWDGYRALVRVQGDTATLTSRNGNDLAAAFPDLLGPLAEAAGDAVLDGEIVALDSRERPDFSALQTRGGLRHRARSRRPPGTLRCT